MSIKDRNLTPGTKLVGKYHKQQYTCQVIQGEGGKLRYRLEDGREFKSPSAAGMAITGHPCDGWVFWSVETAATPQAETQPEVSNQPAQTPETAQTVSEPVEQNAVKKSFFRTPNQKGLTEGMTRWYCQTCGESFLAPYGEIPAACPQGHKA
jgi:hypothetical protein